MRNVRAWIGLAVVALLVSGIGVQAMAEPRASDYFWTEFLIGEFGAIGVGYLGYYVGFSVCGWDNYLYGTPSKCNGIYRFFTGRDDVCLEGGYCSFTLIGAGATIWWLGRGLGAITGVFLVGLNQGVDGNIGGAFLSIGLGLVSVAFGFPGAAAPGIPALLATIGYNYGARMKSDKSKPAALNWSLPLVALRF